MRARGLVSITVVALAGLAACKSTSPGPDTPEDVRERADRYEKAYHLPPGDARFAAARFARLDTPQAYATFETFASKLGMKSLSLDDAPALETLAGMDDARRDALVAKATDDEHVQLVRRLRDAIGYQPQMREVDLLGELSGESVDKLLAPRVTEDLKIVFARLPGTRFPLTAVDAALVLGEASPAQVTAALERFTRLEVDLGVHELNTRTFAVLAYVASRPVALDALTRVRSHFHDFDVAAVTSSGLDTVGAIGAKPLEETLNGIEGTRFAKRITSLDARNARALAALAASPGTASLLSLFETISPDFRFDDENDARALASIAAVGTEGRAAAALTRASRAGAAIDALDAEGTAFARALVSEPDTLEAVRALHGAWPSWHATPPQLPAIRAVAGAPEVSKLGLALGRMGYELGPTLTTETANELSRLARENGAALAEALNLIFPRLLIRDEAALQELHEIAAAGVAPADILRLETGSLAGNLGPKIRSSIVTRARSARGG